MDILTFGVIIDGCLSISKAEDITGKSTIVIAITDSLQDETIKDLYEIVMKAKELDCRVVLITDNEEIEAFRWIASTMVTNRMYDIYLTEVEITYDYINAILERKPSYYEVAHFVDKEVVTEAELGNILGELCENMDNAQEYMNMHRLELQKAKLAVDKMRFLSEEFKAMTINKELANLDKKCNELEKQLRESENSSKEEFQSELESQKTKIGELKDKLREANEEIENYKNKIDANMNTGVISYNTVTTQNKPCKVSNILYFKEIGYTQFVNTLIVMLKTLLELKQKRVKVLIYDNNLEINKYTNLQPINAATYPEVRNTILKNNKSITLISDASTAVITDILEYKLEPYDVLIVYDRMKKIRDLVSGNQVVKFYVVSSESQARNCVENFTNNSKYTIGPSYIDGINMLSIEYDKDYQNLQNESAKLKKYITMKTKNGDSLITRLIDLARINIKGK